MSVQFDSAPVSLPSGAAGAAAAVASAGAPGFAEVLKRLVQSVDSTAADANVAVTEMMAGRGDVHDAMIALHRAETSLQLTIQVRTKLLQAYQEIMRMPV
jgi:flagellar hook-basal body complex protein FliE